MFDIIKTIEKKINTTGNKLSAKLKTVIKEKILANEIPRKTYILSEILCTLCTLYISIDDLCFKKMPHNQLTLIIYMTYATMIAVYIPYTSLKFGKKILSFIAVYAVFILMYIAEYFYDNKGFLLSIFDTSLDYLLIVAVILFIIFVADNVKFALNDEAFKQNLLTSFKYSYIICVAILSATSLFMTFIIPNTKITINSDFVLIAAVIMLLVELITHYVIEYKFEKGLKCDEDEDEE